MARTTSRSGFKMRSGNITPFKQMGSSPVKQNIFKDPDHMAKKYGTGDFAASGSRSKERMRPGESQFQYDVRMKRAKKVTPQEQPSSKMVVPQGTSASGAPLTVPVVTPTGSEITVTGKTPSYTYDFGGNEQFKSDAAEYFNPTPSEWKQDKAKSKWLYKKNPDGSYTTKKGESGKEVIVKKGDKAYSAISGVFKKKSPTLKRQFGKLLFPKQGDLSQ